MAFRSLYKKELKNILPLYIVLAVVIFLWHLFILSKSDIWSNDVVFITAILIPLFVLAAVGIATSYYQLHTEWRSNTIYLLLSLPIRGWKVLTAKLAAVLSLLIISCIWLVISFSLLLLRTSIDELRANVDMFDLLPTLLNFIVNGFWMSLLVVIFTLVLIQFAFLCGQLVTRFKSVVMLMAFLGMIWLLLRIGPLISKLLLWTPDIFVGGRSSDVVYLHSGPFIILLLACIGIIWLSGYMLEKEVEV